MEKFIEYLQEAEKEIHILDHLIYVTFPLVKDKKLLIKITIETNKALKNIMNAILQYEYLYKRIRLSHDANTNLRIFIEKCAPPYKITQQELNTISELQKITKGHETSTMEFVKDNKVVILSEELNHQTLTVEKAKEFVQTAKSILEKTKQIMGKNYLAS